MSTSQLRELYKRDSHFIAYLIHYGAKIQQVNETSIVLDCTFLSQNYDDLRIKHSNSEALSVDQELLKIKRIWQDKQQNKQKHK